MVDSDKQIRFGRRQNLLLLLVVVFVSCIYFLINTPHGTAHVLKTTLDDQIPRIAWWSVVYLAFLLWPCVVVTYSWYRDRAFSQLAYSIIIVEIIIYFIFLTFQTYVPRDPILSDDIFSRLLRFIYYFDQPYNAFPSLHAALSALIATYFICVKSKYSWVVIVFGVLIVISTLFVKQHYIADAISGVGLGVVVTWLVFRLQHQTNVI